MRILPITLTLLKLLGLALASDPCLLGLSFYCYLFAASSNLPLAGNELWLDFWGEGVLLFVLIICYLLGEALLNTGEVLLLLGPPPKRDFPGGELLFCFPGGEFLRESTFSEGE